MSSRARRSVAARLAVVTLATVTAIILPTALHASEREPRRVRVALGPEVAPDFPGAKGVKFGPFIEVDIARGDEVFEFEAPDESFGFALLNVAGVEVGPSFNVEGKRKTGAVGPGMQAVGTTIELGGFIQYHPTDAIRLRADIRHGVNGHEALTGSVSADWVARDADKWLISIGPRITLGTARYQRAYFSVTPQESVVSGLPVFTAGGGVQALGGTVGFIRQIDSRWGVHGYARYDRLVGDAASSPIVREHGSRNQFSTGLALSYTFGNLGL